MTLKIKINVIEEYYALILETEKFRKKETKSIINLQKIWRGYVDRKKYANKKNTVTNISRLFRGFKQRKLFEIIV